MDEIIGFALAVFSGVVVSLITLKLAGRQRAKEERRAEDLRREAALSAIGREQRWNRTASSAALGIVDDVEAVGKLTTVAFDRYGPELSTLVPESAGTVYEHYAAVKKARGLVVSLVTPPHRDAFTSVNPEGINAPRQAIVNVGNSATDALRGLGFSLN